MTEDNADARATEKVDGQLLTILTTEHFVLQTARSATIGEANGRASIYLGALSSSLIALGFAADTSTFPAFVAVVIPSALLLGWFTFVRMVQTSVESVLYLMRVQRIRRWYAKLAPDKPWFADVNPATLPGDEEAVAALSSTGMRPGPLQMLFTAAAMIAALNAIVLGAGICLLLRVDGWAPLPAAIAAGTVLGGAALLGQLVLQQREYARSQSDRTVS